MVVISKRFVKSLVDLLADILRDNRISEDVRREYLERIKNIGLKG